MGFTRGFISPVCPWSDMGGVLLLTGIYKAHLGPRMSLHLLPPWESGGWNLVPPAGFFSFRSFEIAWLYFHAWSGGQAPWSCAVGKSSMSTDGCIQPFRSTLGFVPQSPPVSNAFLNGDSPPDFLYKDLGTIIQSKLQPIYKWMANKSGAGCLFIYIYIYEDV